MELTTRRYLNKQKVAIKKSVVSINKKSLFDSVEYEIAFDSIDNKIKTETIFNNNLIFVGIFFTTLWFLFLFGNNEELKKIIFSISLICFVIPFATRKRIITVFTFYGENIELNFNKNNKNEVVDFANKIIAAANAYLIKKYCKIDRLLPIEPQIEKIQLLLHREIINEDDFELLKNQLLGIANKKSIGFG